MFRPRIIPVLLIDEGKLVKTIQFKNPNYLGDPINATKIFNEKAVDELCVLDISASRNGQINYKLLKEIAEEAFMPLSYGGGVKTVEEALGILKMGYEKIVLGVSALQQPEMVKSLVRMVGSQSVVAAVDYRHTFLTGNRCYIRNGSEKIALSPLIMANQMEALGVGEILLQSIDRDGMMTGLDHETIKAVASSIKIPLIACGGAKDLPDMKAAIQTSGASAVAAGSLFVYYGKKKAILINYPDEKRLIEEGIFE